MIQKLDAECVRLLGSTEVVISPTSVVKELVENALDSGATRITIKLEDFGLGSIEVADNGCGIPSQSISLIGERHCTSKAKSAADLVEGKVDTYGFRGEALASIATVACQLSIATCCPDEAQGRRYMFDLKTCHFNSTPSIVAMQSGTVVTVTGLFVKLPVRRDYYAKSKTRCREIVMQCRQIVAGLSLCRLNCRFSLKHGTGNANSLWETSAGFTAPTVLALVAGPLVSASDFQQMNVDQLLDCSNEHKLECYLPTTSKCHQDRQSLLFRHSSESLFISVNNRPIIDKDFAAAVKSAYVECGILAKGAFPIGCLKLTIPRQQVDVNVDVAKQHVYFGNGKEILVEAVKAKISEFLSSGPGRQVEDETALIINNEEPVKKKSRHQTEPPGFSADLWSRGRAIGEDRQPVQILMSLSPPCTRQKRSTWTDSLTQLHQQRRRQSEKQEEQPESSLVPVEVNREILEEIVEPFEEVEEISLSERLSMAFVNQAARLSTKKPRQLPDEVVQLIDNRPLHQITDESWLHQLRLQEKKAENTPWIQEIGRIDGKILLLLDSKSWTRSNKGQLGNALIGCSLRRLSEAALFSSMMASAQLSKRNLGHNFSLGRYLTPEQLQFLNSLPSKPSNPPLFNVITDQRLVANGFKLRIYSTAPRPSSVKNLNVTSSYYVEVEAAPELPEPFTMTMPNVIGPVVVEIVEAMMVQQNAGVASCRPEIVVEYLKSEVDRLVKLKTLTLDNGDQEEGGNESEFLHQILSQSNDRDSLLSFNCPHAKPLFCWPV